MNHRFRGITQKRHHRLKRHPYFSLTDAYPIREYFDSLSPKRVFNEKFTHRPARARSLQFARSALGVYLQDAITISRSRKNMATAFYAVKTGEKEQ